jgi:hypothetical protein
MIRFHSQFTQQQSIDHYEVVCPYHHAGCNVVCTRRDLDLHLKMCPVAIAALHREREAMMLCIDNREEHSDDDRDSTDESESPFTMKRTKNIPRCDEVIPSLSSDFIVSTELPWPSLSTTSFVSYPSFSDSGCHKRGLNSGESERRSSFNYPRRITTEYEDGNYEVVCPNSVMGCRHTCSR